MDRRNITGIGGNMRRKDVGVVGQKVEGPGHVAGAVVEHEHPVGRRKRKGVDHMLAESEDLVVLVLTHVLCRKQGLASCKQR